MSSNNNRFTTPKGLAQYPSIKTPDTKFNPEGDYKVNLVMEDDEKTNSLVSKLEAILEDFYENDDDVLYAISKGRKVVTQDIYEKDEEGRIVMKFKQKAVITKKDGSKIPIKIRQFDSKGKPIDVNIGRDSVIKVSFTANPYYMPSTRTCGLSLRLLAVQVISLNEFGDASASSYGFEEEEGYNGEEPEDSSKSFEDIDSDVPGDF